MKKVIGQNSRMKWLMTNVINNQAEELFNRNGRSAVLIDSENGSDPVDELFPKTNGNVYASWQSKLRRSPCAVKKSK